MSAGNRILIIEDELPMRTVLSHLLVRQAHRVFVAEDGETGLQKALAESPDLIVLDVMLPKLDGFALCAELRRVCKSTPVLMLTAKGRVEDRVRGLDCGADDYLVKPFSREEFLARVRALLRRTAGPLRPRMEITLGEVRIDFRTQRAWKGKKELHMTAKEFAMLQLMIAAEGEAISRDRFLDAVWGYTSFPTTRTVDKHVFGLREKIEDDPERPRWIHTVFGVGYRIEWPLPEENSTK
jgi:DNA-binding response OmpR family regulator